MTPAWLDPSFSRTIAAEFGPEGLAWIASLPSELDRRLASWGLRLIEVIDPLSIHFVAHVETRDGRRAVLKMGVPGRELDHEVDALAAFGPEVAVRVLAADVARGAILLERLVPGEALDSLPEVEAIEVWLAIVRRLRETPVRTARRTLDDWALGFDGPVVPDLPEPLVREAHSRYIELCASSPTPSLLHGDLHHLNILQGRGEWVVLDPQGVAGDPAFEASAFVRNPSPMIGDDPRLSHLLVHRIGTLAEGLCDPPERVWGWSFAQTVLCNVWSASDVGPHFRCWARVAEALWAIRGDFDA